MNLTQLRNHLTTMLSLASGSEQLSQDELERSIFQATAALSRYFPRERVAQTVYTEDVSAESWTSSSGTAVALANKPIKFDSETITNAAATTTYARDTDYEMDYINGTVTMLAAGSMVDATSHLATYKMGVVTIDVSSVLTEPISVVKVDVLTAEETPQELEGVEVFGDFLTIVTRGNESQRRLADNTHIRIYYYAHHVEPTAGASGSWPRFLDELVLMGASGYALFIEVLQQELQAFTDLASARTALGSLAAVHTAIGTRVTSMTTVHTAVVTALDVVKNGIQAASKSIMSEVDSGLLELVLANAELDQVAVGGTLATAETELGVANTELDKAAAEFALANAEADKANAQHVLGAAELVIANTEIDKSDSLLTDSASQISAGITAVAKADARISSAQAEVLLANAEIDKVDPISGPVDKAEVEIAKLSGILDSAATALGKVTTHTTTGTTSSKGALDPVKAELDKMTTALAKVETELQSSTRNADDYLDTGDALINEINKGIDPAAENRRYADTKVAMAKAYAEEAAGRARDGEARIAEAVQRTAIANAFVNEAVGRVRESDARLAAARGSLDVGKVHLESAVGYNTNALRYLQEAEVDIAECKGRIELANANIATSHGRIEGGLAYIQNGQAYFQEGRAFTESALAYVQTGRSYTESGAAYTRNALGYIAEAEGYVNLAIGYMSNAQAYFTAAEHRWHEMQGFLAEAQGRNDELGHYVEEIAQRVAEMNMYVAEATSYQTSAVSIREGVTMLKEEAEQRLTSFFRALEDRAATMRAPSSGSVRQYASDSIGTRGIGRSW